MRNKSLLAFLLLAAGFALSLLSSCSRNSISLSYTNAKGEVPQLGNLVFRFSNALAKDSMLNVWDSTEYVSFEPAIPGRFRWESPDQLVFSPAGPLRPATTYVATIRDAVLSHSRYDKVNVTEAIRFHTPALELENSQVTWVGDASTQAVPQVELFFNYPINPSDIRDKLNLEVDGTEMEYTLVTLNADNRIALRISSLKLEDKDLDARITIGKGLKPESGTNSTDESIQLSFVIPSPFVLTIQQLEAEHDGTEGVVHVVTSQQPGVEDLRSYLKFEPAVTYSIEQAENGFALRSDKFDVEKSYILTIAKGLRGKIGGILKEDYSGSVAFGELEAGINFTNSKGVYLSKRGGRNIEVRLTSVKKVKLVISKIYENNLVPAQRYGYYPKESGSGYASYQEDEGYYYDDYSQGDATLGDVIYETEIDTRSLPKSGGGHLLDLSRFEDRLPDFKGVYHVMIRSTEDYWVRDSRFISVSDLGLIAREGKDKVFVFVNSIKTALPVNGVNVAVYGANNQLLGTGSANSEGVAEVNLVRKEAGGFRPAMIIAKTQDDFNYLPFNSTRVNTSRFEVGGKRDNPSGLDAFVYAERDLYRPGEQIRFSVIIRDNEWKLPGDIPLKLKFLLPNGKELKTFRKTLNEEGSAEGSIDISGSAITGTYTLEVYSSNDILLAARNFSVEEFVPDRIRVNSILDNEILKPGETAKLTLTAMNFFGPPAADRNYEAEIQVRHKHFSAPALRGFDFSLQNLGSFLEKEVIQGRTDDEGKASYTYTVPAAYAQSGLLQANFYTTVFDETGRPVSKVARADIFTQDIFFGIKSDGYYYYPLNRPVALQLAAANRDGKATSGNARVVVVKHEYRTWLVRSGSYFRYDSQREEKLISESNLTVGANTAFSFVPRSPGDYEVRVYLPGAKSYVKKEFYSYGNWGGSNASFEVNSEGSIDIELNKTDYLAGEKVTALFKTPFSGRMLVTLESDKVVSYQYVEVSNRSAKLDLDLKEEHLPNVYITATLIKPHEMSDIPLTVAHGFRNVKVEAPGRRLPVEILAKKSVRSRTRQKVTVKTKPGSFVTLAAVDNGVLQVSDFKTPDPYNFFYQQKALQVTAYDLYPLLFAEVRTRRSSTGGDGDLEMSKRVNPMPSKRVKILSYWSGIRKADGRGEAEFEFDVPAFSGELRLMAVSYKSECFGSAEGTMTVADPVVISTALPRFLSPGDTLLVPVTLSNTTDKPADLTASLAIQGAVKVAGANQQKIAVKAKSEGRALFHVVADPVIGTATVKVVVNGLGEKFEDATEISVRPASPLQKVTGSGSIVGGISQKIDLGQGDFIPGTRGYQLIVSRSPAMEWGEHLRYLVQYPYGCTEQTVSAAFPQLYYGDMAELLQAGGSGAVNANSNILEAIRKIRMRQLYNGAVTLWDGGGEADWWSTIYAAHFLLEARKAGFDVDPSLLETMLGYIANRMKNRETITYYYNRNQNRKIAPKEVAYGLYVLALANRSNVSTMNYYKANTEMLALDSRYLLAAAFATAGDKKSFNSLLPAAFQGEVSVPQTGGSYYSDVRDEAIALNALLDVDPGNAQVPVMIRHVSDKLKSRDYLNTQERAFSFLALGKFARSASQSTATAAIKVNGKTVANVDGGQWKGDASTLKGSSVEIVTGGKGRMYFYWEAEGISASGAYKEEDNYLRVRKRFYDRFGNPIQGNTFRQNDLIIVGISLEKAYSGTIANVVITDLLPAGFEIENPRTKELPGMDWIRDGESPTALDVRDDRIHFFLDATRNRQVYYYAVRAVSPGLFNMGPVGADAMYNGEYHSYHGAGRIRIVQQ